MDERVEQPQDIIKSRTKPSPGEITLALLFSFATFPAIAEKKAEIPDNYTGNYQSYFYDETENQQHSNSAAKSGSQDVTVREPSSAIAGNTATVQSAPSATAVQPSESKNTNQNNAVDDSEDVSLLRLRQEAPPVHWNSIGRNMEAGGLHGNIGSQIEIDDVRWSNSKKNSGKFKLATMQAFLRHDELPNWYFGFWNAREDDYKGQFSNQDYSGATNTINEFFVGHIFETWRGNIGTEVMVGSETATKRWKSRFKLWQDLRLSNKWSIAGYAYGEYQPQGNQPGNGDLEQYIFETEPAIQYRVNPDLGLYLRPYYYYNRQVRESWGDIVEQEWKVTAGFWRNWYPLLTSLYIGFGQDKIDNASNAKELFYDGRYKFIGGTISYPVFGEVRLYGEFKASFTKEAGLWTYTGHSWNPYTVVGVTYNF
ncbi:Putative OMPG-porin 1 family protein [Kosakonia arachidis]|uniref:Putative OMPG-porin 1 family protein n=1 Tax=Kosakonia arachidis TaxID=551989 RepID=A0A1I6YB30_9ENTR|nr:OmpG porin family protein [Kosakonia arachidis]SFT47736.1 Putative OMPG-porin 1 family protein [Kosakonia arachidis]